MPQSSARAPEAALVQSRLTASGARGELVVDGRTISVAGGAEASISLPSRADSVMVEAWVRQRVGEGVWQFVFPPGSGAGWALQSVMAGEPVAIAPNAVFFRVAGKTPQRIAFVLGRRRDGE
jgi:hypothetical protein